MHTWLAYSRYVADNEKKFFFDFAVVWPITVVFESSSRHEKNLIQTVNLISFDLTDPQIFDFFVLSLFALVTEVFFNYLSQNLPDKRFSDDCQVNLVVSVKNVSFFFVTDEDAKISQSACLSLAKPCLTFPSKDGANLSGAPFRYFQIPLA